MRIGNAAVEQIQHDAYGSVILAATPMFFDKRLPDPGDESLFRLLEKMARKCAELALEPDAGIWEFRGRKRIHTHSRRHVLGGPVAAPPPSPRGWGLTDRAAPLARPQRDTVGEALLERVLERKAQGLHRRRRHRRHGRQSCCCCPNWA